MLVRGLPPDGAVGRSFGWDDPTELLARVVDRLTELAWITRAVHTDGNPGDPPPPTPRPGDQPDVADDPRRMSTTDEIKAFFGGADGAGAGFAIRFTPTEPPADEPDDAADQPAERVPPELPAQRPSQDSQQ